jgi:serine/threonine protein kinase
MVVPPSLLNGSVSAERFQSVACSVVCTYDPLVAEVTVSEDDSAAAEALELLIVEPIFVGGQKRVFLAAESDGTEVVLKVVSLRRGSSQPVDHVLLRAVREVELLANIDSPNVVSVRSSIVNIGVEGSPHAVAWIEEYLDGEDLIDVLPPSVDLWVWDQTADMISGVARGLNELHRRRVVHRDLKPANIRKKSNGTWVVMDPGWGRHLEEDSITGVFQPGTRGYLTPEHAPGAKPDTASDIFGLGLLSWHALTGTPPISASVSNEESFRFLTREQMPSLRNYRDDLPDGAYRMVDRMLQRMPARRFLDAAELLAYIEGEM